MSAALSRPSPLRMRLVETGRGYDLTVTGGAQTETYLIKKSHFRTAASIFGHRTLNTIRDKGAQALISLSSLVQLQDRLSLG